MFHTFSKKIGKLFHLIHKYLKYMCNHCELTIIFIINIYFCIIVIEGTKINDQYSEVYF